MRALINTIQRRSELNHDVLEVAAVGLTAVVIFLLPHLASLLQ
jgi:hypothetical protein